MVASICVSHHFLGQRLCEFSLGHKTSYATLSARFLGEVDPSNVLLINSLQPHGC